MTPKYVVYQCEECGNMFYREVGEVFKDDGAECHVNVILLPQNDEEGMEEFPMCGCLGGNTDHVIVTPTDGE